ncbi:hypothetical protein GQF03_12395 [Sneathiella chungangensis]|uniref:Glutamine amidotransferase domain-containing protein n=1 Tax=Sneathiella chungangensis TaxID=1418234 RepID=A0A845MIK0_9PROT|nr:hypothetical protein [Sneathiella chungangensis]MZR23127.1 hypothetical protein [Sneathiella chungangensis]
MTEESFVSALDFNPYLPVDWLIALVAICALITLFSLWRRGRGTLLRGALMALLILMLANPVLLTEKRKFLDDIALIVLDETNSQKIGQRGETALAAFEELKTKLEAIENLKVETMTVRNKTTSLIGEEDGTHAFANRGEALRNISPGRVAATIFITDGQIHDVPDGAEIHENEGPLHFLLTGDPNEKDRVLRVVKAPAFGIVDQPLQLVVSVEDFGLEEPVEMAAVSVNLDGEPIAAGLARVGDELTLELTLTHGGANFVEIKVDPLDGELTEKNNSAYITINGIRDRLQVLLVSGEPHMGERGWRNILKSDPSVDLVHFTILRPPEKQDGTPITELSLIPFPIRDLFEKKLNDFDLIIFDRYRRRGVLPSSYLHNIANYVKNGGALLEAAGPAFATPLSLYQTPLSEVLPARPTGYVFTEGYIPTVSAIGKRHPVTGLLKAKADADKDWGRWFRMIESEALGGETLMTGPSQQPLLILERSGDGRVAQLLSDHAWLWGRGFEGGGPQSELLRRISHWLMKEPELEEEQLKGTIAGNLLKITRRSLDTAPATVTVTDPDGNTTQLVLSEGEDGAQSGSVPIQTSGLHSLDDGIRKSLIAVGALNPKELHEIRATTEKIAAAAKKTDGGIRWIKTEGIPDFRRTRPDNRQSADYWFGLRANENYEITGYNRQAMLPPLLALFLALSFLCIGWWREGR